MHDHALSLTFLIFIFSFLMFMKIGISDGQPTFESQLLSYQGQTLLAIFVM